MLRGQETILLLAEDLKLLRYGSMSSTNSSTHQRTHILDSRRPQLEKLKTLPKNVLRSSLFGGRTNNFKFQHTCNVAEGEKILYVDFTSLYPYVLKNREYPCGHPQVITENFNYDIKKYFGFVTCKVQPPRQHRYPCSTCTSQW